MYKKHQNSLFRIGLACGLALLLANGCNSKAKSSDTTAIPALEQKNEISTAIATGPSPELAETSVVFDLVARVEELKDEAGWMALETEVADLDVPNLDKAIADLEEAVTAAEKAGRPVPGIRLALALCYGRKDLAEKAYAAVESAERDAKTPGVVFNLAVMYGRKALLENSLRPCTLTVESDPPGAVIRVDGREVGSAPLDLEGVRPGMHKIQAELTGYENSGQEISGRAGTELKVLFQLVPAPVPYTVRIEPAVALVTVNSGVANMGTWSGELRPGSHIVEARLSGYKTLNAALDVPVSATPQELSYRLEPLPARLSVTSNSPASRVFISGVEAGITPLRWETIDFSETEVQVIPVDWRYAAGPVQRVHIAPGGELALDFVLPRKDGTARIPATSAMPEGTLVKLNGETLGRVPFVFAGLAYGDYRLELSRAEYETLVREIRWEGDSDVFPLLLKTVRKELSVRTINVDGKTDDWAGLDPILVDVAGSDLMPEQPGTDVTALYMTRDDKYLYWRVDFADGKPEWRESLIDDQALYCDLVFISASYKGLFNYNLDLRVQMSSDGTQDSYYQLQSQKDGVVVSGKGITYSKGASNLEARILLDPIRTMITSNRSVCVRVYTGPKNVQKYMMSTKNIMIYTGL